MKDSKDSSIVESQLKPTLGLFPTTAIVIGAVIGSGIFVSSASMARSLGSAPLLLAVWAIAGVLTFFGALSQCELVRQMPRTGGLYEYLKVIYGEKVGFLYGWANFAIAGSGAIAAISYIFANYLGEFHALPHLSSEFEKWGVHIPYLGTIFPLADIGTKAVASLLVLGLTLLNIRGVRLGAFVQSVSTSAKMLTILLVVGVAFFFGSKIGSSSHFFAATAKGASLTGWALLGAIGVAMSGAFWSYDGWGNVAYIAGEVKDPAKTIPRALVLGTLSFVTLYLLMNLAYLYILPVDGIGLSPNDRVASTVVSAVLGPVGGTLIALLIMLSTFDCVNSTILTNPRVYFAMAHDGLISPRAGDVHKKFHTPHVALLSQCAWTILLILTGTFDMIANMYVFVNWVLYVLMAVGVFVMRSRHRKNPIPGQMPAWIPAIFAGFASIYVIVTLIGDIQAYRAGEQPVINSLMGLVLVFAGYPLYLYWRRPGRV